MGDVNHPATDYSALRGRVALVDGDIVAYRAAAIAEKTHYLLERVKEGFAEYHNFESMEALKGEQQESDVVWSRKDDLGAELACDAAKSTMDALLSRTGCSAAMEVFLSGRDNFRYKVAVTRPYKGSRDYQPKPKHLKAVRDFLIETYGAKVSDGVEADDSIGIRAGQVSANGFICTIDKDLDQIPGYHYNWVKDNVYYVSAKDAEFALYTQALSGDPVDNIPGMPGIGKKRAEEILTGAKSSKDLFDRTWAVYKESKKNEQESWDYFLEQINLVYIRRSELGYTPHAV